MGEIMKQFDGELDLTVPNYEKEYSCVDSLELSRKSNGITLLMKLVMIARKKPELLEDYVKTESAKNSINAKNSLGMTALMIACANNKTISTHRAVELLLTLNPDINMQDNDGLNALMYFFINEISICTFELILQQNPNIDINANHGMTVLLLACDPQSTYTTCDIIELILQHKPDLNASYDKNYTALDSLCQMYDEQYKRIVSSNSQLSLKYVTQCNRIYILIKKMIRLGAILKSDKLSSYKLVHTITNELIQEYEMTISIKNLLKDKLTSIDAVILHYL